MDKKEIARNRIKTLFNEADSVFDEDFKLANKYVKTARKIAMKFNIKLGRDFKSKFCKYCYFYLKPGANCRVRTKNGNVVYYCMNCKKYMKFALKG